MSDQVLNRYTLQKRQFDLERYYPAAQVWSGLQIDNQRQVTVIIYPLEGSQGGRTTRALWSAELRKLFRLSCQPFEPSIVGFENGGYDEAGKRLVLVMASFQLPNVENWLKEAGRECAAQWRGDHPHKRANLWFHIARLFGALASLHESRIVHRRIMPPNLLVDEGVSRIDKGFLKLGRFEASTFFHSARAGTAAPSQPTDNSSWYAVELGSVSGPQVLGTPAGDVYGLLLSALWLLTDRPNGRELGQFLGHIYHQQPDEARVARRAIIVQAIQDLRSPEEQDFFSVLRRPKFPVAVTAAHYQRKAERVTERLRSAGERQGGPLCLRISESLEWKLDASWKEKTQRWRDWLTEIWVVSYLR